MANILDQARTDIATILKKAGVAAVPADIVFPPDSKLGDLSFPLFNAAKERGVAPAKLAQEIADKLQPTGLVEKIEIAGPYVNFWLKRLEVTDRVVAGLQSRFHRGSSAASGPAHRKERRLKPAATSNALQGKRIMMEMVSPNNNKPLHLGHLRNAFLGESLARMLESQGAKLVRTCLFNDRGLHIAKSMLAYKLWAAGKTPESEGLKGDEFVVGWYVAFEQKAKEEQSLMRQAEELVRKWEAGDKETMELWKKMSGWALDGIAMTLKRLGLKFDKFYYESKLWKAGKKVVAEGLKRGFFKKDKSGAVVIEFNNPLRSTGSPSASQWVLPPKVLQRADGTAIYATADLALGPEKFKKYKLAHSIWCVGQEQNLYLKQLFAVYKMLGYKWADNCEHLSYGLVFLPEGKMKTREGTVVEADALLNKMYELVYEEVKARHAHLSETEIGERAEIIAQAAVRYYLLCVSPKNAVHFDPKASISFTGHTGPYLLYTYARIASILRKAENPKIEARNSKQIQNSKFKIQKFCHLDFNIVSDFGFRISDLEWHLVMLLARFPEIVAQATIDRDPSSLAQYLYSLAKTFSDFYEAVPVLKAQPYERQNRLALLYTIREVLSRGLHLLTMETLEEM